MKLAHFGTFTVRTKAARPGRNMRTCEQMEVQARRSVTFSTGPKLRSLLYPGADMATDAEMDTENGTEMDADVDTDEDAYLELGFGARASPEPKPERAP